MIKKYSLKALEQAINHALHLDETSVAKIEKLQDKVLEIVVTPLETNFFITFDAGKLKLLADYSGEADTLIHSSPLGLIRLSLLPSSKARSLFNDKIRLSGDLVLGEQIKRLFDELDIDWEGHLAQFTGDVVAHQIGSFFRHGLAFKNQFTQSMKKNIKNYLQEELGLLPGKEAILDFFNDIDTLALDVERFQARIKKLLKQSIRTSASPQ